MVLYLEGVRPFACLLELNTDQRRWGDGGVSDDATWGFAGKRLGFRRKPREPVWDPDPGDSLAYTGREYPHGVQRKVRKCPVAGRGGRE